MEKIITFLFMMVVFLFSNFAEASEIPNKSVAEMPIFQPVVNYHGSAPIEQRGIEFRKWLAPSVKIAVSGGSGSGTIVYYDNVKNIAYVATCGHLWNRGTMSAEEGKKKNLTCKILTWYQNDIKLAEPKTYNAKVIFYSYMPDADTALVTFEPDWRPNFFPIAPIDYKYKEGKIMHSIGCDGGDEVAHYEVQIVSLFNKSLTTIKNSPRPGRSGGGLMDDKSYLGTCVATSNIDGSGEGYFTPLSVIHDVYSGNGYDFLLKIKPGSDIAKKIKIIDRSIWHQKYDENYILIPN